MKKQFLILLSILLILNITFFSCGGVGNGYPENQISVSTSNEETSNESISNGDSEESVNESDSDNDLFLDITCDLLPLFGNFDADTCDKVNNFLNFVYDEFGIDSLRGLYLDIKEKGYTEDLWITHTGNSIHVLRSLFLNEAEKIKVISLGEKGVEKNSVLTFGGDVCFGDNYATMPYLQNRKDGVLSKCIKPEWLDIMQKADVAMVNNEFSISDRGSPINKTYTYVANPEHTKYYNEMGVDYVTLANNHVFDYGEDAFNDTLSTLDKYGIAYSGAGRNNKEAEAPFYFIVNGRKIAYISSTRAEKSIKTPEATESSGGVFRCYDNTRLLEVISETKKNCDYVIVLIHWGTEYSSKLERNQRSSAYEYIDAGADLIVGTHAHQLQGIEFYNGKAIFYNLGNFWFNAKPIETGLLKVVLDNECKPEYYFLPGMQEGCKVSFELGTPKGREILNNLESYEEGIKISDDGKVEPK